MMRTSFLLTVWSFWYLAPCTSAQEIEPEDLKPGLLASFQDANKTEITRLEPTIALHLANGEAPHPRLSAENGIYRWKGYINILRNGSYTFDAVLRGQFQLKIDGKEVFSAEVKSDKAETIQSKALEFKSGVYPLEAEYIRPAGLARLELWWKVPQLQREPFYHDVLGHLPQQRSPMFISDLQKEQGRYLVEESGCVRCHQPTEADKVAKGLLDRQGPNLSAIGSRVYAGWLDQWLANPKQLRPHTLMPKLFTEDETGQAERYAVGKYLMSLGGPMIPGRSPNPKEIFQSITRGKALFTTSGCVACHQEPNKAEAPKEVPISVYGLYSSSTSYYELGNLADKTTPNPLAKYLGNPHALNPTTRMPNMTLNGQEANDLANFLCLGKEKSIPDAPKRDNAPSKQLWEATLKTLNQSADLETLQKKNQDEQWLELGKRLVSTKGCVNCHILAPNNQPLPTILKAKTLAELGPSDKGCIAEKPSASSAQYGFSKTDRDCITAFLKEGLTGVGAKADSYQARIAIKRFNCLSCHQREKEGGLPTELVEQMQKLEKAENMDDIRPPTLTGVGHKLRTPWLQQVLLNGGRSRPWMSLRMPQYGEANVKDLALGITQMEGAERDDQVHQVALTPQKIETGRQIVGKNNGLGCISCHDIAGIANTGTRGPDLSTTNQRVRYEWFRRWMEQPLRMAPGTRMPQIFIDGNSVLPNVLGGKPDAQAEAIWAYMSLGPNLPLPEGLETPKGLIVAVGKEPEVMRTFLSDAGNRAFAVGYPTQKNVAFDANACRLTYAWSGNFIDASPVWNDRGGRPAKILGPKFWTSPEGHPWSIGDTPADYSKRASDPAYGASLPDLQLFKGKRKVFFDGHSLTDKKLVSFHYHLLGAGDAKLQITETPEPIQSSIATGLIRRFQIEPPEQPIWFLAGAANGNPQFYDWEGKPIPKDGSGPRQEQGVKNRLLILPQEGQQTLVLAVLSGDGFRWRLEQSQGTTKALLYLPDKKAKTRRNLDFAIWNIARPEPDLLKGLTISVK